LPEEREEGGALKISISDDACLRHANAFGRCVAGAGGVQEEKSLISPGNAMFFLTMIK